MAPRVAEPMREVITSPDDEILEDHDIIESQEPPQMTISHKRKPTWTRELIQDGEKYGAPEGTMRQVKKLKPFSQLYGFDVRSLREGAYLLCVRNREKNRKHTFKIFVN
jgi:hypothetical protein